MVSLLLPIPTKITPRGKKDLAHVDYKKTMTANFDDFYEAHIEALKKKI